MARSAAEQALPLLEARLKEIAEDTFTMVELAWVYLALGRNNDALRVARQAADLISVQRDTVSGPFFQTGLAQIQARAGAPDEAVNSLRQLMSIPAGQWISLARRSASRSLATLKSGAAHMSRMTFSRRDTRAIASGTFGCSVKP